MKIKVLNPDCQPFRAHEGDAGLDLKANIPEPVQILPGAIQTIPLGVAIEIPVGWVGDLRPRSGLAKNRNLAPVYGTIDAGYRGEIMAGMLNHGPRVQHIQPHERIAQLVIVRCNTEWDEIGEDVELSCSERGDAGFGSTGRF